MPTTSRTVRQAAVIARRLGDLFAALNEARARVGAPELTNTEVVEKANDATHPDRHLNKDTVRHLREGRNARGEAPNPTVNTLNALGAAFGLANGAAYFTGNDDDAARMLAQVRTAHGLATVSPDTGVAGIMQRAAVLPESKQKLFSTLLDDLLAAEAEHRRP
ncbi:hypothetical protein ABTX81_30530 [Kitasatospora sp. NPDC097605]|uniref:hypothetical protein n=1 Tax=Kitasatospora sp. NPDC097605 TaxID=3157226 RepID=UPI003323F54A